MTEETPAAAAAPGEELNLSGKDLDDAMELTGVDLADRDSAPRGRFIAAHQYMQLRRTGVDLPDFETFYANGSLQTGLLLGPPDPTGPGGSNG